MAPSIANGSCIKYKVRIIDNKTVDATGGGVETGQLAPAGQIIPIKSQSTGVDSLEPTTAPRVEEQ